jgi:sulfur-oxidizing protein SoxY
MEHSDHIRSRRDVLLGAAAIGGAMVVAPLAALATAEQVEEQAKKTFPGKTAQAGKIKLDLPSIAENGLVVPLNFEIESPMTEKDFVKVVHFFAEGNPSPLIAAFHYTPQIPKAAGQIRIRMAATQNIVAYAEMSNGDVYTAKKEVKVTIGGCGG